MFPTGRRVFSQRQVRDEAETIKLSDLFAQAEKSIAHDEETLQLELRKRAAPGPNQFNPETTRLDSKLDRAVTGLNEFLDSQVRLFDDEPRGEAAGKMQRAILPMAWRPSRNCPMCRKANRFARCSRV
ncbi:MAG: hypothetical protein MJE77_37460 [Proteobacteria bacterium]|nr:hypothetical protein [Pseudomonadota bacterium]